MPLIPSLIQLKFHGKIINKHSISFTTCNVKLIYYNILTYYVYIKNKQNCVLYYHLKYSKLIYSLKKYILRNIYV